MTQGIWELQRFYGERRMAGARHCCASSIWIATAGPAMYVYSGAPC
jgi:hypothetical protein